MIKLIVTATIAILLAACSTVYGTGASSSSDRMSSTASMGAPGLMQDGAGPRGSSGGGPN